MEECQRAGRAKRAAHGHKCAGEMIRLLMSLYQQEAFYRAKGTKSSRRKKGERRALTATCAPAVNTARLLLLESVSLSFKENRKQVQMTTKSTLG